MPRAAASSTQSSGTRARSSPALRGGVSPKYGGGQARAPARYTASKAARTRQKRASVRSSASVGRRRCGTILSTDRSRASKKPATQALLSLDSSATPGSRSWVRHQASSHGSSDRTTNDAPYVAIKSEARLRRSVRPSRTRQTVDVPSASFALHPGSHRATRPQPTCPGTRAQRSGIGCDSRSPSLSARRRHPTLPHQG